MRMGNGLCTTSYLSEGELDLGVEDPPLAVLGERRHARGVGAAGEGEFNRHFRDIPKPVSNLVKCFDPVVS